MNAGFREDRGGPSGAPRPTVAAMANIPLTRPFEPVPFPQMANWLPDDEANQLRFEFAQELERLKQAA
jgi:hypothetical protein